jgi:hypothetical protein
MQMEQPLRLRLVRTPWRVAVLHRELEAARKNGLEARILIPLTRAHGGPALQPASISHVGRCSQLERCPFIIAAGIAVAAIAVMLVERFGHVMGYWLMAGGLAAIGVVAAIAVSVKEHGEEVTEQHAEQTDTQEAFNEATSQAMVQAPLALLGALFTTPGGATSALKVAPLLGRNFPLVLAPGDDWCSVLAEC